MEKELYRMQAENRLCGTLLRLGWLVALGAFVPVLLHGLFFGAALGYAMRALILVLFVLITFGAILLYESFRDLFRADGLEQLQALADKVTAAYQALMPVFLVLSVCFLALNIFFVHKNGAPKTGRLVSAVLSALCTAIAALLYYTAVQGGAA